MSTDEQLRVHMHNDVAEVGGSFHCQISRSPIDGETNKPGRGEVRAIRVRLGWETQGRGTRESRKVAEVEVPVDEYGMASADVELAVPPDAPISYDGSLIRVLWTMEATTDVKFQLDPESVIDVLVVPVGGTGWYDRPHPLRSRGH